MRLHDLIQDILKNKFSVSYKNGNNHFLKGNVKFISVKKVNNITNIYGRVLDGVKIYSTQIRINNENKSELICNCDFSKEIRGAGGSLPCEHVIATLLQYNKDNSLLVTEKNDMGIKLKIEEVFNREYKFKVTLFLGNTEKIKIASKTDLQTLLQFSHMKCSKENEKLLKFISDIDFKVRDQNIRKLFLLCKDSEHSIRIDSIEYKNRIRQENIPLRFTLKIEENKIKLQTLKARVIAINKELTVFLFDNHIYIPPINWCKTYEPLYKIFSKKSYTFVKAEAIEKVIRILKYIGKLNINDDVKNILAKECSINLSFTKDAKGLYCKLIIPKEKEFLLGSDKVKTIEEILYNNSFTKKDNHYYFLGEDSDLINLLRGKLKDMCRIISTDDIINFGLLSYKDVNKNISKDGENIRFNLYTDNIESEEWGIAIDSYIEGNDFYRFSDYSFLDFSDDKTSRFMEFLTFINYAGNEMKLPMGYEEAIAAFTGESNFIESINKDSKQDIEAVLEIEGLKAELRDYQKEGLLWLQNKKEKGLFGILADDMGLGKTIQTISFILNNKNDKTMVVAPASVVYNWEEEFYRFAPDLKVLCIYGDKDNRKKMIDKISNYDVILTSYGTLNMDIDLYKDYIFDNFIIDEAQTIKNAKSKVAKNVKLINSRVKFALTGTPIENNYLEIWSIFDFLKHGYLFSEKEFKTKFLRGNEKQVEYLKLAIKPFILRRTKKQVLKELPDKTERTFYVDMTKEQKRYYKLTLKGVNLHQNQNTISMLAMLTKLRQIAIDPSIVDSDYMGGSGKLQKCFEIIDVCIKSNKKMLIFSQFTSLLNILKDKLDSLGIKYFYLDGSTKASERVKLCNDFNKAKSPNVFLISLKAGGTGLNLTSAETVVHFDPWWNPAVENQATDRAHRIGQKNNLEVIKIISKDTVEEKMVKLKEEKKDIFDKLLYNDDISALSNTKLSKEEIKYLLLDK